MLLPTIPIRRIADVISILFLLHRLHFKNQRKTVLEPSIKMRVAAIKQLPCRILL